jgi:predicted nucleotidyltransferase
MLENEVLKMKLKPNKDEVTYELRKLIELKGMPFSRLAEHVAYSGEKRMYTQEGERENIIWQRTLQ